MPTRLEELRQVDRVLTELSQGYSNAEYIGDKIFKRTIVDKESAKYQHYGKERFIDYGNRLMRPIRVEPKEKDSSLPVLKDYSCDAYSLAGLVDQREISESSPLLSLLVEGVDEPMENLRLNKEKQQADLLSDTANYDAANVDTPVTKWDNTTNIAIEIENYKNQLRSTIGRNPNMIVMGANVWEKAFNFNTTLSEKIKYSERDVLTTELVAQILGVEKILVGYSLYTDDIANPIQDIWGNMLVLCYVVQREGRNIPTFARSFQKKGYPNVKKWQEGGDFFKYRVEDIYDNKITGPDAGLLVNLPVA